MSDIRFEVGAIVKLKSGGPSMTVKGENNHFVSKELQTYSCQWFAGKKLEEGQFPPESLEAVEESE